MTNFAKTSWNEKGQLVADNFGDVYCSPNNGYEETKYVFLQGNDLPQRWDNKNEFTIIETGFGTGLNFLATWHLWNKQENKPRLNCISIEKYPLKPEIFNQAHKNQTKITAIKEILNQAYPALIENKINSIEIAPNVNLTLIVGDVADTLTDIKGKADAWFLDGFSPKKNPEMWNSTL